MKLDKELQFKILNLLIDSYPNASSAAYRAIKDMLSQDLFKTAANMAYLQEHGLIEDCFELLATENDLDFYRQNPDFDPYRFYPPTITAEGIDFLLDDGGLTALKKTIRVRLEEETIRRLFEEQVKLLEISEEKKSVVLDEMKKVPAEVLKSLLSNALQKVVLNLPAISSLTGSI